MFRIPYHYPTWEPGLQLVNLGQGGPASHPREQATVPRVWPTVYAVGVPGIGPMPRQVLGPTPVIQPFPTALPPQGLLIAGLQKAPQGPAT